MGSTYGLRYLTIDRYRKPKISPEIQEIRAIDNANKFEQPDRAAMAKDGVSVQFPRPRSVFRVRLCALLCQQIMKRKRPFPYSTRRNREAFATTVAFVPLPHDKASSRGRCIPALGMLTVGRPQRLPLRDCRGLSGL